MIQLNTIITNELSLLTPGEPTFEGISLSSKRIKRVYYFKIPKDVAAIVNKLLFDEVIHDIKRKIFNIDHHCHWKAYSLFKKCKGQCGTWFPHKKFCTNGCCKTYGCSKKCRCVNGNALICTFGCGH